MRPHDIARDSHSHSRGLVCVLYILGPCSKPLGLMSGSVHDWQLSASSSYPADKDSECHIRFARLHQPRGRAWCAKYKSPNEWILVDLGVAAQVRIIQQFLNLACQDELSDIEIHLLGLSGLGVHS